MNYDRANIRLGGLTAENPRYARLLIPVFTDALEAVSSYTYRSLLLLGREPVLSDEFERLAQESLSHVRLLGELIVALGGDPVIYTPTATEAEEISRDTPDGRLPRLCSRLLSESLREERRAVERCETLMGKTDDRIVRSILSQIVRDKQVHLRRLAAAC